MKHVIVTPWAERMLNPPERMALHIDEIRAVFPNKSEGCRIVTQSNINGGTIEVAEPMEYFVQLLEDRQ